MNRRPTLSDAFPDRREQSVVIAAMLLGFAAMMTVGISVGLRHGGWRDIEDGSARRTVRFVVNINQADRIEFAQLPRIGPTLARRIVEYRGAQGDFKSKAQIMEVPGIGEKMLLAITPYITIGDEMPDQETTAPSLARRP